MLMEQLQHIAIDTDDGRLTQQTVTAICHVRPDHFCKSRLPVNTLWTVQPICTLSLLYKGMCWSALATDMIPCHTGSCSGLYLIIGELVNKYKFVQILSRIKA